MAIRCCSLVAVMFTLLAPAAGASHKKNIQDFEMWTPIYLDAPLINRNLRLYFEAQPRIGDNLHRMSQLRIRQAIGYQFNNHVAFYQGYAWAPNYFPAKRDEQRLYQQLGIGHVLFRRLNVLHRLRLEERMIEHVPGTSMRARYYLRGALPVADTRWYIIASDEIFVTLNKTHNGPLRGLHQNRVLVGIGRQVNEYMRVETGYLLRLIERRNFEQENHALTTRVLLNF